MSTELETGSGPAQYDAPLVFPDILAVIEGMLTVATDDDKVGRTALHGFQYLLSREFVRQQPALSMLYELDFVLLGVRSGSRIYDFKILVTLKQRVKSEIKKAGSVAVVSLVLGIPGAILSSFQVYDHLFPPIQNQLNSDMPQAPIIIQVREIRQADSRDVQPKTGQTFTL